MPLRDYAPSLATPRGSPLDAPLSSRIARAIAEDVRQRRLVAGEALPGSRELARRLGVHRNTVLAALRELGDQGYLETSERRGTFISRAFAEGHARAPKVAAERERPAFDFPPFASREPVAQVAPGLLPLLGGVADLRLVPHTELSRALRRALLRPADALAYGPERGAPALCAALSRYLLEFRGLRAGPERLMTTSGSQQAFFLVAKALLRPGDVVAVEALGYSPAWEAFKLAGAELVPVPLDAQGLNTQALAELCRRHNVRAVYVTPHHQYPTTVTLAAPRRQQLLALARAERFIIIEDDFDHEHHFEGQPVLPLASTDAEVVAYVGTLSKVLAPGLRIGYVAAREEVIERAARVRSFVSRQGFLPLERALAELFEDGVLLRHLRRVRREYHERRDVLTSALERELGSALSFEVPRGGMALWAKIEVPGVSSDAWAERALALGVLVQPGRRFRFDGRELGHLRLGFAALNAVELKRAIALLARALPVPKRTRAERSLRAERPH